MSKSHTTPTLFHILSWVSQMSSCILYAIPKDIAQIIGKMVHVEKQKQINRHISRYVEKIEDAKYIDDLDYHHLHHIKNCVDVPFFNTESYKYSTYKWIYQISEDCTTKKDNNIKYCSKRNVYLTSERIYFNGNAHISCAIDNQRKQFKLIKIEN